MIEEREFRERLADLIKRFDAAMSGTKAEKEEWDDEWLDLAYVVSDNQYDRMEKLYVLHSRNRGL